MHLTVFGSPTGAPSAELGITRLHRAMLEPMLLAARRGASQPVANLHFRGM
jgi:hypothetical protein